MILDIILKHLPNILPRVLAANGIKAYLFDGIRPTPELSFAVKIIGAAAGIVITASQSARLQWL